MKRLFYKKDFFIFLWLCSMIVKTSAGMTSPELEANKRYVSPQDRELLEIFHMVVAAEKIPDEKEKFNRIQDILHIQVTLSTYLIMHMKPDIYTPSFFTIVHAKDVGTFIRKKDDDPLYYRAQYLLCYLIDTFFDPGQKAARKHLEYLLFMTALITNILEFYGAFLAPLNPVEIEELPLEESAPKQDVRFNITHKDLSTLSEEELTTVHAMTDQEHHACTIMSKPLFETSWLYEPYESIRNRFAPILQKNPMIITYLLILNFKYLHQQLPLFCRQPMVTQKRVAAIASKFAWQSSSTCISTQTLLRDLVSLTQVKNPSFSPGKKCLLSVKKPTPLFKKRTGI